MSKARILIVDDEVLVAESVRGTLEMLGFTVLDVTTTGEEAVQKTEALSPDLVLMDVKLYGEMDGVEAAEQIRARLEVPVVYLTAYSDSETVQRAKSTEPYGYVLKPLDPRDLHNTIEMALYKHQMDRKLRQRNRELALLNRAGQAFSASLDLDQVLATVLDEVRHLLGIVACAIWLLDPETDELVCHQATGPQSEVVRGWRLAPGQGIAGRTAQSGESTIVADTRQDARHFKGVDQQTGLALRSILSVPLRVARPEDGQGQVIGTLQAVDTQVGRFGPEDLRLLGSLAATAASHIENARLYQQAAQLWTFNETIVQNVQDAIALVDPTGHILFVNARGAEMLGRSAEALVGRHWTDFIAPEQQAQVEQAFARRPQSGTGRYESTLLTPDGRQVTGIVSAHPLFKDERLTGVLATFTDITERKQAEDTLRLNEARLEALLKLGQMTDTSFQEIADFALEEIVQLTRSKIGFLGFMAEDEQVTIIHAWSRDAMAECEVVDSPLHFPIDGAGIWAEAVRRRQPIMVNDYAAPNPAKRGYPDGHVPLTRFVSVPVFEDKQIVAVASVGNKDTEYDASDVRQITLLMRGMWRIAQRQRAQEALQDSERRYRLLAEHATDMISVHTPEGVYRYASPACRDLLGYAPQELVGRDAYALFHPDEEDLVRASHATILAQDTIHAVEYRIRCKNGNYRWVETTSKTIRDPETDQVQEIIAITRDITARKQAERALQHALAEATRSRRSLIALGQAAQAVQRARSPQAVYQAIGDEVVKLGYQAVIFALTDDRRHLALAHLTLDPELLQAGEALTGLRVQGFRFPLIPGGFYHQRFILDQEAVLTDLVGDPLDETLPRSLHPLAKQLINLMNVEQAIYAPLVVDGETRGLLAVIGTGLSEADLSAITGFANQAAIALENARLFQQVRQGRERMKALSRQLLEIQERERRHIARELHDQIGQTLTGLNLLLGISDHAPADEVGVRLAEARAMVKELMERVDQLSLDLRPAMLDDLGLLPALLWQVERYTTQFGIEVQLEHQGLDGRFAPELETAVYRVVQEALTNVARHAGVKEATARLWVDGERLTVQIEDRGSGFDPQAALEAGETSGLSGMQERVALLGGQLLIESTPGGGTCLTAEWPLGPLCGEESQ